MPTGNAAPVLFFLFPRTISQREENGKNQTNVLFFKMSTKVQPEVLKP